MISNTRRIPLILCIDGEQLNIVKEMAGNYPYNQPEYIKGSEHSTDAPRSRNSCSHHDKFQIADVSEQRLAVVVPSFRS